MGFLTVFDFSDFRNTLHQTFSGSLALTSRMRFTCTVRKAEKHSADENTPSFSPPDASLDRIERQSCSLLNVNTTNKRPSSPASGFAALSPCMPPDFVSELPSSKEIESFQVLNELVVDRGPSAYISKFEIYLNGRHLTTVQADGLVVASPTGSTAYSVRDLQF